VQVAAEMTELFPDSQVVVNPEQAGPVDLALVVLVTGSLVARSREVLAWGRRHRGRASLALGFYSLDPRHFEVVPAAQFGRWARRQQLVAAGTSARLQFPRAWARFASVYRRCASFS
jgi:hypothetical protein